MDQELLKKFKNFKGSEIKKMDHIKGGTQKSANQTATEVTCTPHGNSENDPDLS